MSGGDEVLRFELDGKERGARLRIERLTRQMVAELPARVFDLLEIATLVYAVDSSVSRGGTALSQMGKKWHRRFVIDMPIRDLDFWTQSEVQDALESLLFFLSGDRFEFRFVAKSDDEAEASRFFKFSSELAWSPDRVLMFSGGLDSFAGALEEIVRRENKVALVSHFSATKIAPIQANLQKAIAKKFGDSVSRHFPVSINMVGSTVVEGTHRSRSFLFSVLGAVFANAFGRDRVSFYENGIVSLNLPPVGNVLSTRATRTTHPQTLTLMTALLSLVFDGGMRINNPFFWHTKTEVLKVVADLSMVEQIAHTRSCADVHNQTKQHVHCGRCSQCIDRRFAVLATGLDAHDPKEAYRVDLLEGVRKSAMDREIVLSYVRNAERYEQITPELISQTMPEVLRAVDHLDQPASTALENICQLLKRHGRSVMGVMNSTHAQRLGEEATESTLPRLYGDVRREQMFERFEPVARIPDTGSDRVKVEIDRAHRRVSIDDAVLFKGNATADLLLELADVHLLSAGKGLPLFDFETIGARALARRLSLGSDEAVRRRVLRCRTELKKKFASANLDVQFAESLIENVQGQGYRLRPEVVEVVVVQSTQ